jgi:hypothetical protein
MMEKDGDSETRVGNIMAWRCRGD